MKKVILVLLIFIIANKVYAQSAGGILAGDTISHDPSYTVIYRNIADTTISAGVTTQPVDYRFDLDSDGIQDFSAYLFCFHVMGGGNTYCTLRPLKNNGRIAVYADSCHGMNPVERLDSNASIDAERVWQNKEEPLYQWSWSFQPYSDWTCGTWLDQTSKFAGLSLIGATDTLYGWIRMSVLDQNCVTLTIHDFAVKKRNPLGISGKDLLSVKISPNPTQEKCRITLTEPAESVRIFNSRGVLINDFTRVQKEVFVNMEGFPAGIYYAHIRNDRTSAVRKIILK